MPCRASPPQVGRLAGRTGFPKQLVSQPGGTVDGREVQATCDLPLVGEMPGRAEGGATRDPQPYPRS
ncbi:hypothetical protein ELI55_04160, partial [Rhizobium ruizarguesonis]